MAKLLPVRLCIKKICSVMNISLAIALAPTYILGRLVDTY